MKNKIVLICLLLVGCATAAQREARHAGEVFARANTQHKICKAVIFKKPENHILWKQLVHPGDKPTLAQLRDKTKATKEEISALDNVESEEEECDKVHLETITPVAPLMVTVLADEEEALDSNMLDLVERKITWGEYQKRTQAAVADSREGLNEALLQMNAQWQESHEVELAERQAAIDAIGRLLAYYDNARHAKLHHADYKADYKVHE
jgi:hypothetical protein